MKYKKQYKILLKTFLLLLPMMAITACSKSQSYSELLRQEEKAVNWYLAGKNVEQQLPDNPKDIITGETMGEDAPFYKLDNDGYVYMQVVSAEFDDMVEEGDLVYFRYTRKNIKNMYEGVETSPSGNSDYLPNGTTSFVYRNTTLESSTRWGTGIQMPLKYVGYYSEVNIVLKSYYGFTAEQSSCEPYIVNIRYFKPEY